MTRRAAVRSAWAALVLALCVAGTTVRAQAPPQPGGQTSPAAEARARALFTQAVRLHQSEQLPAAIDSYRQVLALKPQSASTLHNLGKAYATVGDVDEALRYSAEAAAIGDPNQAFYKLEYADLLSQSNRRQEAIAEYRSLLSAGVPHARNALTELYLAGPPDELVAYLWELIEAGDVLTAADAALGALESGNQAQSADFLTVAVRALGHETLTEDQSQALRARLAPLTANSRIGSGVEQALRLFDTPQGNFSWWAERTTPWQDPPVGVWPLDAFRQLARTLGARAERADDVSRAEAYYLTAARLREDELDPLAFQALCKLYVRQNEVDKLQAIVSRSTDQLFSQKNEGYRRGQLAKIYDYHVTLGYIYGSLAQQNVIGWGSPTTPNSAVFQLEHAVSVGRTLDAPAANGVAPTQTHVDPGVVELLAGYYAEHDRAQEAVELRNDAGRRLEAVGRTHAATEVLRAVPEALRQQPDVRRLDTVQPPIGARIDVAEPVPLQQQVLRPNAAQQAVQQTQQ